MGEGYLLCDVLYQCFWVTSIPEDGGHLFNYHLVGLYIRASPQEPRQFSLDDAPEGIPRMSRPVL